MIYWADFPRQRFYCLRIHLRGCLGEVDDWITNAKIFDWTSGSCFPFRSLCRCGSITRHIQFDPLVLIWSLWFVTKFTKYTMSFLDCCDNFPYDLGIRRSGAQNEQGTTDTIHVAWQRRRKWDLDGSSSWIPNVNLALFGSISNRKASDSGNQHKSSLATVVWQAVALLAGELSPDRETAFKARNKTICLSSIIW